MENEKFTCPACGHEMMAPAMPEKCEKCGAEMKQEEAPETEGTEEDAA